jgi:hypothetical protein
VLNDGSKVGAPGQAGPKGKTLLRKITRVEWLGQTVASACWIVSVFVYGIESTGDWLQLSAASAWMVANLAQLVSNSDNG